MKRYMALWFHKSRLDGQCCGPEEYFRILLQSWSSRKLGSEGQSTAKAEYIAASAAYRDAVWLRKLLSELFRTELEPTVVHCENQKLHKAHREPGVS
jgi:hypothetical protein